MGYELEMMATINDRIVELMEALKLGQSEFARLIGESRQNVSNMTSGREPRAETLLKIKEATNVSWKWLMNGEGEMFGDIQETQSNVRLVGPLSEQEFVDLPYIDARVVASFTEHIYGTMKKTFTDKTYRVMREPGHDYAKAMVLDIIGDSMLPNFRNGMRVIVRQVPEGQWATITGVCAISLKSGMFTMKRIVTNKENILTLKADNPSIHEEMEVQLADVLAMFKVGEGVYTPPV